MNALKEINFLVKKAAGGNDVPITAGDIAKEKRDLMDFNKRIVVPTKKKYGGRPGIDYNPARMESDFNIDTYTNDSDLVHKEDVEARKKLKEKMPFLPIIASPLMATRSAGYYDPKRKGAPTISINTDSGLPGLRNLMTHEHQHLQSLDGHQPSFMDRVKKRPVGGRSSQENAILDKAYRFTPEAISSIVLGSDDRYRQSVQAEEASTNREYRRAIDDELTGILGRKPTQEEFEQFVDQLSDDDTMRIYETYGNPYTNNMRYEREKGARYKPGFFDKKMDDWMTKGWRAFGKAPYPYPPNRENRPRPVREVDGLKMFSSPEELDRYEEYQRSLEDYKNRLDANREWLMWLRRAWKEVAQNPAASPYAGRVGAGHAMA